MTEKIEKVARGGKLQTDCQSLRQLAYTECNLISVIIKRQRGNENITNNFPERKCIWLRGQEAFLNLPLKSFEGEASLMTLVMAFHTIRYSAPYAISTKFNVMPY